MACVLCLGLVVATHDSRHAVGDVLIPDVCASLDGIDSSDPWQHREGERWATTSSGGTAAGHVGGVQMPHTRGVAVDVLSRYRPMSGRSWRRPLRSLYAGACGVVRPRPERRWDEVLYCDASGRGTVYLYTHSAGQGGGDANVANSVE
jgi:hypothetical protein